MKKNKNKSGVTYHKKATSNNRVSSKKINNNSTKSTTKKKKSCNLKNIKLTPTLLITILVFIALIVLAYFTIGLLFTVIWVIGIVLIISFSAFIRKLRRKKGWRIATNILLILMLLMCIAGTLGVGAFFYYVVKQAPEFDVQLLERKESTLFYDINNVLRAEIGAEKREKITYDEISQIFIDALIATEDSRFFQHNGFDAARFIKASIGQVAGDSDAGGASTLSMQVIKTNFTDAKLDQGFAGIVRKFTDIYLAVFKLEKNYSKQEIIEFYINNNYMGDTAHGLEQASQTYFGKKAKELNLAEASLLAGIYKSPYTLNPYLNPDKATERRATVLNLMVMHGYITDEERKMANSIPITSLLIGKEQEEYEYQWYIDTAVREIQERYGVNAYNTPMIIYTNMDPDKQKGLDNIVYGVNYQWRDDKMQTAIAAIDADTGKIVAIVGGRDKGRLLSNRATQMKRQIGSTAKPLFDYAPGMEYLNWSTYTMWEDKEYYYSSGQPMNNSDRQYWGWMTTRRALAYSRNVPALQAFQKLTEQKVDVIKFVTSLGITPEIENGKIHEAHSIGSFNGSNPLQMAAAYAAFANGGTYYEPYTVNKVIFRNTGEEYEYKSEGTRVMSDSTAFMITDCLKSAVNYGVSGAAKVEGVNVAAKTGTTNFPESLLVNAGAPLSSVNDAWIIGYDPEYVIGMWLGYDDFKDGYLTPESATSERAKIFNAAGNAVFKKNGQDFKVPSSVVYSAVELGTYPISLPSSDTPEDMITYEYFKAGTEPTEISTKYINLKNVTNLKVTYNPSTLTVNLSWTKANKSQSESSSYGKFGYKIYKDNKYLGFTTNNSYTITDSQDPFGTYKVVTAYEKFDTIDSPGATYELINKITYSVELLVSSERTYEISETLDSWDLKPSASDIEVYGDGKQINDFKVIISIKNSKGETVGNMTTTETDKFTITYNISIDGETVGSISRTVNIE